MSAVNHVALPCEISRGGFSDERIFKVRILKGEYTGVASRRYCWDQNDEPLEEDEPSTGETIQGKVAARVLEVTSAAVLVSVPDGEVVTVNRSQLLERPATHVSI